MAANSTRCFIAAFRLIAIIVTATTLVQAQWATDDRGCRTPKRGVGDCILVTNCQPILDVILQADMITQDIVDMLRSYQCGWQENQAKVCCPRSPILQKKTAEKAPVVEKVDSDHKNLHLLPQECGISGFQNAVTYGEITSLFEFPWMALLAYDTEDNHKHLCGGTLINDMYILTAAHCIVNVPFNLTGVRLGEYNTSSTLDCDRVPTGETICAPPVQDIDIAEIIPHPNYDAAALTNDIGLIRLAKPANTTIDSVKPICLPTTASLKYMDFTNSRLTVTGWGVTESHQPSSALLKVDVRVISNSNCQNAYNDITTYTKPKINPQQICAGGDKTDSCKGDSGGPLQKIRNINNNIRFVQYGIVSYGARLCGAGGVPGVYARVDYFMDWILDTIKA